jgi:hypothetical protein
MRESARARGTEVWDRRAVRVGEYEFGHVERGSNDYEKAKAVVK